MNLNERMLKKLKEALSQKTIKRKANTMGLNCDCEVTPNEINIVERESGNIIGTLEYEVHIDEHEVTIYIYQLEIMNNKREIVNELIKCLKNNVVNEYVPGYGEENVIVRMDVPNENLKPVIDRIFGNHGIKIARNKKEMKRKANPGNWYDEEPWENEEEIEDDEDDEDNKPWEDEDEIPDFDPEEDEENGVIIILPGENENKNGIDIPDDAEVIDVEIDLKFYEFDDHKNNCKHLAVENRRTGKIAVWDDDKGRRILVGRLKSNKNGYWYQIDFNRFKKQADRISRNRLWKQLIIATI